MTTDKFFTTTRRHFIQTTAAVSAAGLWVGRANAGPAAAGFSVSNFALELDGSAAGLLSAVTIPEHVITKGDTFGLGPAAASYAISEANAIFDWIMSLPRKQAQSKSGAIILADHNFNEKRRFEFTDGLITDVQFPKLSASDGKKPFTVDVKWQPSAGSHSNGSGKLTVPAPKKSKTISTSAFRLKGLPAESDYVTSITLPSVSVPTEAARKGAVKAANIKFGDITIEFSGRSRDSVYQYVKGVIADGKLTDNEYLDLTIELLDPAQVKALASVQLIGCGLKSYKEGRIEANNESVAKFTLGFGVERLDLVL
jgi:hypothetical protein